MMFNFNIPLRTILTVLTVFILSQSILSQDRKVELLERLYMQGNYKRMLKKSQQLIEDPVYSKEPKAYFYKALSLISLRKDKRYTHGHPFVKTDIRKAIEKYKEKDPEYKVAEAYELTIDERSFFDFPVQKNRTVAETITKKNDIKPVVTNEIESKLNAEEETESELVSDITPFSEPVIVKEKEIKELKKDTVSSDMNIGEVINEVSGKIYTTEERVVFYAESYIGVPYKYGGNDHNGFDCSGFTGHVLKTFGGKLPRSAREQYALSKKIKKKKAQKGDLVFFGKNKNKISHVGIVSSNPGEELTMIHASSSRGIMFTNIDQDVYWKPKFIGVGRVKIEDAQ